MRPSGLIVVVVVVDDEEVVEEEEVGDAVNSAFVPAHQKSSQGEFAGCCDANIRTE